MSTTAAVACATRWGQAILGIPYPLIPDTLPQIPYLSLDTPRPRKDMGPKIPYPPPR